MVRITYICDNYADVMMKYKKFRHTERPFVLHVFIGGEPVQIAEKMNKVKSRSKQRDYYFADDHFELDPLNEAAMFDLAEVLPGQYCLIFRDNVTPGQISHELVHVISHHFRYIGTPLTLETEESYAYMMSWLTDEIHKLL